MNKTQDSGLIERLRKQARSRSSRSHETLEWAAIAALEAKDARIAELGADLSFADSLLSAIIRCDDEMAGRGGLPDAIDNDGEHYQSAYLQARLTDARAALRSRAATGEQP